MSGDDDVELVVRVSGRTRDLLAVLGDPALVLAELADHAQQGVYRPGAWERGWLEQVFGPDFQERLEPDTDNVSADGRVIYQRPKRA